MRWLNTIAGLLVAASAIAVVQVINTTPVDSGATAQPLPSPTAVFAPAMVESSPTGLAPDLPGVSPEVAAALGDSGYSVFADPADVDELLTPEVVRTLVTHGAILVVPEPDTANGGR